MARKTLFAPPEIEDFRFLPVVSARDICACFVVVVVVVVVAVEILVIVGSDGLTESQTSRLLRERKLTVQQHPLLLPTSLLHLHQPHPPAFAL